MNIKKLIVATCLPLFLTSLLFSQSVAELAKKEKERREKLKETKEEVVVTNADLSKISKRPAISTPSSQIVMEAASPEQKPPKTSTGLFPPAADEKIDSREPGGPTPEDLQAKWLQAQEYVNLLTIKFNGLWQEFYSMDDMTDREGIQQQIRQTAAQIEKAQEDEIRARQEWEKARSGARITQKRRN